MLEIRCLLSETCKSEDMLRENIKEAIRLEGVKANIEILRLGDKTAKRHQMKGSPTVLINHEEVQPQNIEGVS